MSVLDARQAPAGAVQIDADDIGGVVTSKTGPEAGVWVIAETTQLPTKYAKVVVTDDQGKYVLPDLPKATYNVWVRGYGLVDSKPVQAAPGKALNLTAVVAATPAEAAKVYPATYWLSLIKIPEVSEFPGTGPSGNGIAANMRTQHEWIDTIKTGCGYCHQLGTEITRTLKASPTRGTQAAAAHAAAGVMVGTAGAAGPSQDSIAAWDRRVQVGQRGAQMSAVMSRFGRNRGLAMFADWTERIAAGETPKVKPRRPEGQERNVVLTIRDWGTETAYVHDEVTTDKRKPTVNAGGPVYGVAISNDLLTIIDPKTNTASSIKLPVRDDPSTIPPMIPQTVPNPSPYFGSEVIWTNPANPHNPMMDHKARVWSTHQIRKSENPDWCKEGSTNPFAKAAPVDRSERQLSIYDPKTQKWTLIDTCFGAHHLHFAEDKQNTLWVSGGGNVLGWLDVEKFDATGDEKASQGWCSYVVDTNADGKIGPDIVGENDPVDPKKDKRVRGGSYGIIPSPTDGSVWVAKTGPFPGQILRMHRGANPPETCMAEVYTVPFKPGTPGKVGYTPRGIDIDRNGVVWTALAGSGHLASFDRRKCKTLNGPTAASGEHCEEGWTLYPDPEPTMLAEGINTDFHYYNWVDQFNTLGLGENIPISNGSSSDSLLAMDPKTGKWTILRVPYPMGFHTRGLDGRIDDPNAGWKGRGLWATNGGAVTWHIEGGKGVKPKMIHFQLRPNPLAK